METVAQATDTDLQGAIAFVQSFTPRWTNYIPIIPSPKQQLGLCLDHVEEGFYGGAAGGGKSIWLLAGALQYVDEPDYNALIMRRTYQELAKPEALMDVARKWLYPTDAHWDGTNHMWRFPSGATMSFGYCENDNDVEQYQSAAYHYIGFDESTKFTGRQYLFMSSRMRRVTSSRIPIRKRSASNPGGVGHDFFKERFNVKQPRQNPSDRFFIPATIDDNPHLSREDYIKRLMHLLPVDRERMLNGDWDAMEGGAVISRGWFKTFLRECPRHVVGRGRAWDLAATGAATPEDEQNPLIKRTAGTKMSKTVDGLYVVEDCVAGKWAPGERDEMIETTTRADGYGTKVLVEEEPGSGGISQNDTIKKRVPGYPFESMKVTGEKYVRLGPFASHAQLGKVALVDGGWVEAYLQELHEMKHEPPKYVGYKDRADSSSLVFNFLFPKKATGDAPPPPKDESWQKQIPTIANIPDDWRKQWPGNGPQGDGSPPIINNFGD